MTEKGIPEKKRFVSLLDDYPCTDEGFAVQGDPSVHTYPKFRELEDIGLTGHEFLSDRIYYCNYIKSGKAGDIVEVECRAEYVQLFIGLKGKLRISDGQGRFFDIHPDTVQLARYANGRVQIISRSQGTVEVFVVNIHKSLIRPEKPYFKKLFPLVRESAPSVLCTFAPKPFLISLRMRQIVGELSRKEYSGHFLEHYVEIKIRELLLLYLNEWTLFQEGEQQADREPECTRIGKQMDKVRELLLANFTEPLGLKSLAMAVGTNEFHLKVHFKAHFGKSVMAYLREYKMEKAKMLLLGSDRSISDIAESLGYRYATHFSSAFKKHYGKLPKDFRQGVLSGGNIITIMSLL